MTDTVVKEAFLALVRRGLKTGKGGSFPALDIRQWECVLELGTAQGVTGLLFSGVESLPPEIVVPEQVIFRLMVEADRIMRKTGKVSKAADSLVKALEAKGLHPIIMKGPAVAAYYQDPNLRESGDLDIFLRPGEFEAAVDTLSIKDYHKDPDGNILYSWEGVPIDQHPRYFDLHSKKSLELETDSPEARLLMLSLHIRKHCMGAGVGLRQICDMAMAYRALLKQSDNQRLLDLYKKSRSSRWNLLLASFIKEYLGDVPLPYAAGTSLPNPAPLHKIVFSGGSFGHYDPSRRQALKKGGASRKIDTLVRMLRRIPFSLRYSRSELLPFLISLIRGNVV